MSARILVVDDNSINRRLMQATLEARYYTVAQAANGPEALRMALELAPEVVLLDVMMPGMDGYEVCRRLKNDDRTRHIPVVMLTALNDAENRVKGLEAGADDFLSKPVNDLDLVTRLETLTRYHELANELRQRGASPDGDLALTETELDFLQRPGGILIIDQTDRHADRLARPLRDAGHTAIVWQRAQNDAGLFQSGLDLVVINLPEKPDDVLRLCAQVRQIDGGKRIALLVICEADDRDLATEALKLGASDIATRPVNPAELTARCNTQLRRVRYLDILRRRVDLGVELSMVDSLTGLFNRRYMTDMLDRQLRRALEGGEPLSVVAFDIDHFKRVNDRYGHEVGDVVLADIGARLASNVRPGDIACRPGGEEFILILPGTGPELAQQGAERIRRAVAGEPFEIGRERPAIQVTISAGIASLQPAGDRVPDLLRRADEALYRAKSRGRNRIEIHAA